MKKALNFTGLIVIFVIIALLIAALFVKKDYFVVRNITLNKSKQEVYDYVKYLKNQGTFNVWSKIDPVMKTEFRGTDGTVGFISAWDSKNRDAGRGEQEIIGIKEGERIDYEIRFFEPMKSTDNAFMTFQPVSDSSTNLKWGFFGRMKYPMNVMFLFMDMDAMLGNDLESGLSNLKTILEK